MERTIIVTTHARERYLERYPKSKETVDAAARNSFEKGKPLKQSLKKTVRLLGYHLENFWTASYRVYQNAVFVFQPEYRNGNQIMTLVTVYPLTYLKDRQRRMLNKTFNS